MILKRLTELNDLLKNCTCTYEKDQIELIKGFEEFRFLLHQVTEKNSIVYVIGNGGSAGIASHFCTDLIKTLQIPSMTLVDSNLLTCLSNDYGYDNSYRASLKILMKPNDVLVAISSSGRSDNILNATSLANEKGAKVVTLSGFDITNPLRQMGNLNFWLSSKDYGHVEMGHFFLLHTMIDLYKHLNFKQLADTNVIHA